MTGPPEPAGSGRGIFPPQLLDQCISCGFCLPACPTYQLTGDEAASPRGRITLMRALETGALDQDDPALVEQASFCLGCRACEPVCPAGVRYGELLERWRTHQWRGRRRPWLALVLTLVLSRRWLLRVLGRVRRAARTGRGAAAAAGGGVQPQLLLGCAERFLYPRVSRAARRLAPELAAPPAQGCCGALLAHNGDLDRGRELARRLGRELPGPIVTTAGGCAAHLAEALGPGRVQEFSAYLAGRGAPLPELRVAGRRARVALQDSCHARNALGGAGPPRELLRRVADYVELPGSGECCGAAGTYALLRPRDSARILSVKLDQIEAAGVDYVVVVNPGCLRQLRIGLRRRGSRARAVHLAELLAGDTRFGRRHERVVRRNRSG